MFIELIHQTAVLLALCLAQAINAQLLRERKTLKQISTGVLFGGICLIGMMTPITIAPGAIFDARGVVLSMTGLFGGVWAALIAALMAGAYRLSLGGIGADIGLAAIAASALLGLAYRYVYGKGWARIGLAQLVVFGAMVHAVSVLLFTLFPSTISNAVMRNVALPYLTVFSAATACMGLLLQYIEERVTTEAALRASEARYARVIEGSDQGFWEYDLKNREYVVSTRLETMVGYQPGEMLRKPDAWSHYIHPADLPRVTEAIQQHRQGLAPYFEAEFRHRTPSGEWRWILTRGKIVTRDENDDPWIMSGTHTDIADRKKAEEELKLASMVYQTSSEAMTVTDANGTILAVNPAFTETTGFTAEEVIGKNPRILQSGHHGKAFYEAMWHELNATGRWQGEIWNRRRNGELYPEWLNINSTYGEDGTVHRRVALFSDITKKKQLEDLLWQQANIDLLTGLPNRRMLFDRLQQEMKKADRNKTAMALLFLDLDEFKDVNDTMGHDVGDTLLKETAQRLTNCVRKIDTVARLGGDEFTLLISDLTHTEHADQIATKIMDALTEPFQLGDELAYVSASMGITFYPNDASKPEDLLKNADQAMYAAKDDGKNTYHFFTPSMQDAAQARRRLINDLRIGLKDQQISVYYQPIYDLKTGRINKAEALVRWRHPERGMIPPIEFIPLAEETGLIVELGDYVFREAAQHAKRLRELYDPQFQISVNKSAIQFRKDEAVFSAWLDHLQELALQGNGIVIEITESLLMENNADTIRRLDEYHRAGLQIALDDFGTGYSSLSYLKKFNLDYLKIDQSFVRNLDSDPQDRALCEAIIVMAHKLGIKVIAEGVETRRQLELLSAAGCDYVQGYLFSKPIPEKEFGEFLKQTSEKMPAPSA